MNPNAKIVQTLVAHALLGLTMMVALWSVVPLHAAPDEPKEDGAIYLKEPGPVPPPTIVSRLKDESKYADGSVRNQREVLRLSDDRIVNHGAYVEYYPNGQKFCEGSYHMGVHDGQWKYWHANGQECKTILFQQGRPEGDWEVYRQDGTRLTSQGYRNGMRHGHWVRYFDDSDKVKVEENYENGQLEGDRFSYFRNGKKRQEAHFKAGKLDGTMTGWNEEGEKISEIPFVDGKVEGRVVHWTEDGQMSEKSFREGKIVRDSGGEDELVPLEPNKQPDEL
jgi:antitoxin component YwqK of YwqJK toxin-antitoxin module